MAVRELEPRTLNVFLGSMRLWRDDLEQIESVMQEAAAEVFILTDKYQIDKVADLAQLKEPRIKSLHFVAEGGRVQLVIKGSGAYLQVLDPNLQERGMAAEITQIANRCRKFGGVRTMRSSASIAVVTGVLSVAAIAMTVVAVAGGVDYARQNDLPSAVAWLAIPSSLATASLGYLYARNTINTRTRAEAPPWMKRNADALVTNAIVSAIFLFLGIWIGKLTN
ncbi:hypothetical protein AB0J68_22380 [Micromonospora sp. NPDC049580]|uniref:hypothetical protein n=1 Tax=Micromonospora sp. NPDC049580 TaxID=3154832 RepID=UPI0034227ECA